jgi:hypothetical protein
MAILQRFAQLPVGPLQLVWIVQLRMTCVGPWAKGGPLSKRAVNRAQECPTRVANGTTAETKPCEAGSADKRGAAHCRDSRLASALNGPYPGGIPVRGRRYDLVWATAESQYCC